MTNTTSQPELTANNGVPAVQVEFHQKFAQGAQEYPHRIRRCFMTGKQCIFSGHSPAGKAMMAAQQPGSEIRGPFTVFVIMPFRPNLDTFYEWSLKRYLRDGLELTDPNTQIRRADEFRDIGYVMCEKICRRIQEAHLVVVDLSVSNPNVMYELGLAIGLHKPLLALCNSTERERLGEGFLESVGLSSDSLVTYPSVGYLPPIVVQKCVRVNIGPRQASQKIVPLVMPSTSTMGNISDDVSVPDEKDIQVQFRDALRAAVGVAMAEMDEAQNKSPELQEAWGILGPENIKTLGTLKEEDDVELLGKDRKPKSFEDVAKSVDAAFTCIIDLAGENPQSYFWLGYCHARGINGIPIYRDMPQKVTGDGGIEKKRYDADKGEEAKHVIAFDIRALWFIHFRPGNIRLLADTLGASLEELIAKDVPGQQRSIFWERLTREPQIHIYTGAVHHERLEREVVGDWDQRTVSELVRYLSSAEESVVPELERPIYAPETIKAKLEGDWQDPASLDTYVELVERELQDKNCLIVASPDVNPLTEVVLAKAYGVPEVRFRAPTSIELKPAAQQKIVVALKGWKSDPTPCSNNREEPPLSEGMEDKGISMFFSRTGKQDGLKEGKRGFLVENRVIDREYKSQDDAKEGEPFRLLSHLVLMRNPFSERNLDTFIVLLNGVSGPGSFAIAEVLTGGRSTDKAIASEKLLKEFNRVWREAESQGKRLKKLYGVEAIIEVNIEPKIQSTSEGVASTIGENGKDVAEESRRTVGGKFYDQRQVVSLDFPEEELAMGNPREIIFDLPDKLGERERNVNNTI